VRISDPNPADDLSLKFIADFPGDPNETRDLGTSPFPGHDDGTPWSVTTSVEVNCSQLFPSFPSHRIKAVVADRDFVSQGANFLALKKPEGKIDQVDWTLLTECGP
jgi:hypothetical protein